MKTRMLAVAATLLVACLAGTADASLVIDVTQVGSNVLATGSGSIDLTDLSFSTTILTATGTIPTFADIAVGPAPGTSGADLYTGATGPANFGPGAATIASSGSGDTLGVVGAFGYIAVPTGYVSGTALSGSSTFDGTTIAGLGLTPGTYTYTWGLGADADSLTVNIGSVPEPSSLTMAAVAIAGGLVVVCRRRP
jgi:hypothetical protein